MTPLVLVHGFLGGGAQWNGQRAAFSDAFHVIALDLPGFGTNAHLPVLKSIGAFADWVIGQLRARKVTRYHLLGHSMGGMIAQEIARRDAAHVDRLVLYATGAIGVLPGRFETISQSKARAIADGARATARRIAATWFGDHEASKGYETCAQIAEQASLDAQLAGLDAMENWSGRGTLIRLATETLVLWGDQDRTYSWEQIQILWNEIPHSNLAVIPGCAHAVHLEKPELFNQILGDFLRQNVTTRRKVMAQYS